MLRRCLVCSLMLIFLGLGRPIAEASEGASSYYFPGSNTAFGVAVSPAPGFMVANQLLFYQGSARQAVLGGRVQLDLKANAVYDYLAGFYTFKKPVWGGWLQIGAAVPAGFVDIRASASAGLGSRTISSYNSGLGAVMTSASLYWKKGHTHYKLTEAVFMPTGYYNPLSMANSPRNYWSFDTSLAMTWLNKRGLEFSVTPGIMFNGRNHATDYQSGNELHVDVAVNQFFNKQFAAGLHGYYYKQVSGDSGAGAKLGAFQGRSLGFGPAILWLPKFGKGDLSVVLKWMHDIDDHNRMRGDYGQFVIGYKF